MRTNPTFFRDFSTSSFLRDPALGGPDPPLRPGRHTPAVTTKGEELEISASVMAPKWVTHRRGARTLQNQRVRHPPALRFRRPQCLLSWDLLTVVVHIMDIEGAVAD